MIIWEGHKMKTYTINIQAIRDVARRFDRQTLEQCQQQILSNLSNACYNNGNAEENISILAKAEYVRQQMDKGKTPAEAIRELGQRMRTVQG